MKMSISPTGLYLHILKNAQGLIGTKCMLSPFKKMTFQFCIRSSCSVSSLYLHKNMTSLLSTNIPIAQLSQKKTKASSSSHHLKSVRNLSRYALPPQNESKFNQGLGSLWSSLNVHKSGKCFCSSALSSIGNQASMRFSSSALHVRKGYPSSQKIVKPDVDVDAVLSEENIPKLRENINRRKMRLDIDILMQDYEKFREVRDVFQKVETEKQDITKKVKLLVGQFETTGKTSEAVKRMKTLTKRGRELREELSGLKDQWLDIEDKIMIQVLELPNWLDICTKDHENILLEHHKTCSSADQFIKEMEPPISYKDHVELASRLPDGNIHFRGVSPKAYYLEGRLAEAELSLVDHFSDQLLEAGFTPLSCPDMFKSVVVEGCGVDTEDPEQVLTLSCRGDLEDGDSPDSESSSTKTQPGSAGGLEWSITYHLTGVSHMAATAYITKNYIWEKSLPAKWYSVGRHYQPAKEDLNGPSLFNTCQSSRVQLCAATVNCSESDIMYQEMVDLLQRLYTPKTTSEIFPYGRMRSVPAPQLAMWESCRNEFQLWSPSLRKFITVAAVSKSNDFISKRLMIKHSGGHHVHMVHGYVADVTKLIACLLEQSQTKNGEVSLPLFQSFVEMK